MKMIKHRVEITVKNAGQTVLQLQNLTLKRLIINLLLGTKLMLLIPGQSIEMVNIKEVERSEVV